MQHKTKQLQFCAIKTHHFLMFMSVFLTRDRIRVESREGREGTPNKWSLRKAYSQGCSEQKPHLTHLPHPGLCNQGPEFRVVLSIGPEVSRDVIQLFSPVA